MAKGPHLEDRSLKESQVKDLPESLWLWDSFKLVEMGEGRRKGPNGWIACVYLPRANQGQPRTAQQVKSS